MVRIKKSLKHDSATASSLMRDSRLGLADVLRNGRYRKQLSQQQLAHKLGMRQRQISDVERAAADSRLSTIQNVARALDLELMLVPRQLIAAVEALQRAGMEDGKRPLYALDEEPPDVSGEVVPDEVGDAGAFHPPTSRPRRARKGSRQ